MRMMMIFSLTLLVLVAMATNQSLPGCLNKCGNVSIPYPFGVGGNCFHKLKNSFNLFNLTCQNNSKLVYGVNLHVLNISLEGQMDITMFVSRLCRSPTGVVESNGPSRLLTDFTISSVANRFVTLGCDSYGYLKTVVDNHTDTTGCLTRCDSPPTEINSHNCSGIGCCQVNIPRGMRNISVEAYTFANQYSKLLNFSNCTYAFVAKRGSFHFSLDYLKYFPNNHTQIVVDWNIPDGNCTTQSLPCSSNSHCNNSDDGLGYSCTCNTGYRGNPYLSNDCKDIDECSEGSHDCTQICVNTPGSFQCHCPPHFTGDGTKAGSRCQPPSRINLLTKLLIGISVSLLLVFTLISWLCLALKQRALKQLRRRNFEENGGIMLQGYGDRTKIFTETDLKKATNNFEESKILGRGGQGTVYKGILLDSTEVAIKKSKVGGDPRQIKDFINEVAVLSQINHKNVVKLLGCCLETEVPLLVYEFVDNGTLLDHIDPSKNECPIPWETRLRIAAETAEAISYLHSSVSIPIVHRDIKSTNILLDHSHRAKVSDFGASRLVPLDEAQVSTVVQGTLGYLDPEYLHTGQLNEKSDVYSFGVVLVELLTGSKAVEFNRSEQRNLAMYFVASMKEDRLWEILDKRVLDQKKNDEQLKEVALLARRCLRVNGEERPTMKEVAKELEGLIAMQKNPRVNLDDLVSEESYNVVAFDGYDATSASTSIACDTIHKQIEFEEGR